MVIANVAKYTAEANVPALYMDAEAVAEGKSYENIVRAGLAADTG